MQPKQSHHSTTKGRTHTAPRCIITTLLGATNRLKTKKESNKFASENKQRKAAAN
jgi:hypothetical protein